MAISPSTRAVAGMVPDNGIRAKVLRLDLDELRSETRSLTDRMISRMELVISLLTGDRSNEKDPILPSESMAIPLRSSRSDLGAPLYDDLLPSATITTSSSSTPVASPFLRSASSILATILDAPLPMPVPSPPPLEASSSISTSLSSPAASPASSSRSNSRAPAVVDQIHIIAMVVSTSATQYSMKFPNSPSSPSTYSNQFSGEIPTNLIDLELDGDPHHLRPPDPPPAVSPPPPPLVPSPPVYLPPPMTAILPQPVTLPPSPSSQLWPEHPHYNACHLFEETPHRDVYFLCHISKAEKLNAMNLLMAEVQADDHECDIALLTIENENCWEGMNFVELGDILFLQEAMVVVGHTQGGDNTSVAKEVVSMVEPTQLVHGASQLMAVQIAAIINPGNNGEPLLDSSESVIGINSAIYSPFGAFSGAGFSIPVDTVSDIVDPLVRFGKVTRRILGIEFALDQSVEQLGVSVVLVLDAPSHGPAGKVCLQSTKRDSYGRLILRDIITSVKW